MLAVFLYNFSGSQVVDDLLHTKAVPVLARIVFVDVISSPFIALTLYNEINIFCASYPEWAPVIFLIYCILPISFHKMIINYISQYEWRAYNAH